LQKSKNKSGINKKAKKKEDEMFKKLAKKAMQDAKLKALVILYLISIYSRIIILSIVSTSWKWALLWSRWKSMMSL
jgi:hypothetical protein